jgi:nitrogen-specific signal transduction histidine kinase
MSPIPDREKALDLYLNNPYECIIVLRHDLMNPLNVIHSAAGLLVEMLDDPELKATDLKKLTQLIVQSSEGLREVFDEIAEFERIRRDKDQPVSPDKQ